MQQFPSFRLSIVDSVLFVNYKLQGDRNVHEENEMESYHVRHWMQAKRKCRKVWTINITFNEASQRKFSI